MLNGVLAWAGGFLQRSATTNTAQEIASDIADIHYNNKRGGAIFNLVVTIVFAGGGAALCVLEPTLNNYFKSQVFSFLGNIAATIFGGAVGAWFGGAVGTNIGKVLEQYYESSGGNHTNGEYNITDTTIQNIINANPLHINPQDLLNMLQQGAANLGGANPQALVQDLEQGLQQGLFNNLHLDQQSLRTLFDEMINLIDEHKNDGTPAKKEIKYALLSATRRLNLHPLNDWVAKNDIKREARVQVAAQVARHLGHPIGAEQINNPYDRRAAIQDGAQRTAQRVGRRRRPVQRAAQNVEVARAVDGPHENVQVLPQAPVEGNNNAVPLVPNPHAQHQPDGQPLPLPQQQPQMVPVVGPVGPFRNTLEYYRELHSGKAVDPRRARVITPQDPDFNLNAQERAELLNLVQLTVHQQRSKQLAQRVTTEPVTRVYRGGVRPGRRV